MRGMHCWCQNLQQSNSEEYRFKLYPLGLNFPVRRSEVPVCAKPTYTVIYLREQLFKPPLSVIKCKNLELILQESHTNINLFWMCLKFSVWQLMTICAGSTGMLKGSNHHLKHEGNRFLPNFPSSIPFKCLINLNEIKASMMITKLCAFSSLLQALEKQWNHYQQLHEAALTFCNWRTR